jgi:hypothetical protein
MRRIKYFIQFLLVILTCFTGISGFVLAVVLNPIYMVLKGRKMSPLVILDWVSATIFNIVLEMEKLGKDYRDPMEPVRSGTGSEYPF